MVWIHPKKNICLIILPLLFLLPGCTETIEIDGFDKTQWKTDRKGCNGDRDPLSFVLFSGKDRLFDQNQRAIRKLLGSPDKTQLYSRNQEFFVYYISKGAQCDPELENEGATLHIRFGALNKVNEVFIVE